jgi:hypothetical protein
LALFQYLPHGTLDHSLKFFIILEGMRRREGKLETQLFTTNSQEGRNISHSG